MMITACPKCGKQYKVPQTIIGKPVQCRGCRQPFDVQAIKKSLPAPSEPFLPTSISTPTATTPTSTTEHQRTMPATVLTSCTNCNWEYKVPETFVGETRQCTKCRETFVIKSLKKFPPSPSESTVATSIPVPTPKIPAPNNGDSAITLASIFGGIWNWVSGKDKCPNCGSRNSNRISTRVIKKWQEIMPDIFNARKDFSVPNAWFNCHILQAESQCNECRHSWIFKFRHDEKV